MRTLDAPVLCIAVLLAATLSSTLSLSAVDNDHSPRSRPGAGKASAEPATAIFSMYCYWTGEATLGRQPGVLQSAIGHLGGEEIVQVKYDSAVTSPAELARALRDQSSLYGVIVRSWEEKQTLSASFDGDLRVVSGKPRFIPSKHSLRTRHPDLYYLDLHESQAIALNSWSYFGGTMPQVLDPEQQNRHQKLRTRLQSGDPPPLDPDGARQGTALQEYRERLVAWLSE